MKTEKKIALLCEMRKTISNDEREGLCNAYYNAHYKIMGNIDVNMLKTIPELKYYKPTKQSSYIINLPDNNYWFPLNEEGQNCRFFIIDVVMIELQNKLENEKRKANKRVFIIAIILIIIGMLGFFKTASSQSQTGVPNGWGTNTSVGTVGWNNAFNNKSIDNVYESSNVIGSGKTSFYTTSINYNILIPNNAIISGIEVRIKRKAIGTGIIRDNSIKIIKGGVITGNNHSVTNVWRNDSIVVYGSPTDLWGTTWTPSNINNLNSFGVAISVVNNGASNSIASIDNVTIIVFYLSALPVELIYFEVQNENNCNRITWGTASECNNYLWYVERSYDGVNWFWIYSLPGQGSKSSQTDYMEMDCDYYGETVYYRLKQVDYNGEYTYSKILSISYTGINELMKTYNSNDYSIHNLLGQKVTNEYEGIIIEKKGYKVTKKLIIR